MKYKNLTKAEKKIYDSIKMAFPKTSHLTIMSYAIQGGTTWQLVNKH